MGDVPGVTVGFVHVTVVVVPLSVAFTFVGEAGPWATAAAGQPPKPGPPSSPSSWMVTP